jgi:L-seryl-tRNA(Ser) seleniumtransferase
MARSGAPRPPAVERLLAATRPLLAGEREHAALVIAAQAVIAAERGRLADGAEPRELAALAGELADQLASFADPVGDPLGSGLVRVINATGVILHTNLGRAPWPAVAIEAAAAAAAGYSLLELDRASGRRGARFRAAEEHLIALTGAEDALITNNNAAAVALAVGLAGRGGGVVVSRGELVEIGGGVRIPEIVRRAGARLVEVGTTNRTRVADFEEALAGGRGRVVLRVHPSNFVISGFTESPDPLAVAALAHRHGVLVIDDLGSGALLPTERYGLIHEPLPSERLAAGADLVTFSGDKLLGGPQAGLVVGRADLIARLRRDPLARAVRPDKTTLAALGATLGLYRAGLAEAQVPVWQMIAADPAHLRARAESIRASLPVPPRGVVSVEATASTVGGGSLPGETLPSFGLALRSGSADRRLADLRRGSPCVVARIADGAVLFDLRTVLPVDDQALGQAIAQLDAG